MILFNNQTGSSWTHQARTGMFALVVLLLLSLSGCGGAEDAPTTQAGDSHTESTDTDHAGHEDEEPRIMRQKANPGLTAKPQH